MVDNIDNPEHIPPSSVEAEEAVIGSILINADSLFEVASFLQASDFFIARHMWIWEAILAIHERFEAIDNITLIQELRQRGQIDDIGGPAYITYLINNTPTHIHAVTYGRIVQRAAARRRLLNAAGDIAQMALEENAELDVIEDRAQSTLDKAIDRKRVVRGTSMQSIVSRHMDRVEYRYKNKGKANITAVSTGFLELDDLLDGGLQKTELTLLAARPRVGKSALMLNIARNAALCGQYVDIWSGEMPADGTVMDRLAANEIGVNSRLIKTGNLDEEQYSLYVEAAARMTHWSINIDDTPGKSISQIALSARRAYRERRIDLLIVDHLGLVRPSGNYRGNKNLEIGEISWSLKELQMSLGIPVLALCQLNRDVESRQDKRPVLDDLRDSGELEQNADCVMFLYREDMYDDTSERVNQADVIVAKARSGTEGVASLFFRKELQRFSNMSKTQVNLANY